MCIYLGENADNSIKSEEHIFPACIGGIKKLNNNEVSAEANKIFMKLENAFAHRSEVQLSRGFYGPGKRGKDKKNESSIVMLYDKNNQGELGYMYMGKAYTIPQILIYRESNTFTFTSMEKEETKAKVTAEKFFNDIAKFNILEDKFMHIYMGRNDASPDLIIGIADKKIIIASHTVRENLDKAFINNYIKKLTGAVLGETESKTITNPHVVMPFELSDDINRVFAKIAFNSLCYLKGADFVNCKEFDNFRKWIITGEGSSENWIDENIAPHIETAITFPKNSHWCIFTISNKKVCAVVCLYEHWTRKYIIGDLPKNETLPLIGYICDYQNHIEYTLSEYIYNLAKNNHELLEGNNE